MLFPARGEAQGGGISKAAFPSMTAVPQKNTLYCYAYNALSCAESC